MTKKNFNIIAAFVGAVFVLALIYLFAGVASDKKNGPARAETLFEQLIDDTSKAAGLYEVNSYNFSDSFIKSAGDFKNYKTLSLSLDGKLIYSYPAKNAPVTNSDSIKKSQNIQTAGGSTLFIEADIFTVNPNSLYSHSRIAFLIILIATLAAILVLIFAKTNDYSNDNDVDITFDDESGKINIVTDASDSESAAPSANDEDKIIFNSQEIKFTDDNDKVIFTDETDDKNSHDDIIEPAEENNEEPSEEFVTPEAESAPVSTISPEMIHKEIELSPNLEEELVNAASTEQDLSIIVVKTSGLEHNNEAGVNVADEIKNITVSNALIYEYGSDEYVLVIRNTKLDEALSVAEQIHTKVNELLAHNNLTNEVTLGISARTERLISAERLLTEAVEAQKHANAKDSPIIAFRVNPEKYRNFILNS